jgi:hypothetical protein
MVFMKVREKSQKFDWIKTFQFDYPIYKDIEYNYTEQKSLATCDI